ncbi:MAG: hypothetical protein ACTS3F_10455 [Phycisphaerales bacterium]
MNRHTDRNQSHPHDPAQRPPDAAAPGMEVYHAALDRARRSRAQRRRIAGGAGIAGAGALALAWLLMPTVPPTPRGAPSSDGSGAVATRNAPDHASHTGSPDAPAPQNPPAHAALSRTTIIAGAPVREAQIVGNLPAERLAAMTIERSAPRRVERATDAQLIATFDELGQPVGIIRFKGQTTLARLDQTHTTTNPTP